MAMLRFSGVSCDKIANLSFALDGGAIGVLRVASKEEKAVALELAVGERQPEAGTVTLRETALEASPPGSIAWLPESGGLISNLKAWENATLPLWYHRHPRTGLAEHKIRRWLSMMGVGEDNMAALMASPAGKLRTAERKMIGLLRCLLQEPHLIVLDAAVFNGVAHDRRDAWVEMLEVFVRQAEDCAILAVADGDNSLPWNMVDNSETKI